MDKRAGGSVRRSGGMLPAHLRGGLPRRLRHLEHFKRVDVVAGVRRQSRIHVIARGGIAFDRPLDPPHAPKKPDELNVLGDGLEYAPRIEGPSAFDRQARPTIEPRLAPDDPRLK